MYRNIMFPEDKPYPVVFRSLSAVVPFCDRRSLHFFVLVIPLFVCLRYPRSIFIVVWYALHCFVLLFVAFRL